jgi:5'-AMP-activated protein kinase catalytic alpha subunit
MYEEIRIFIFKKILSYLCTTLKVFYFFHVRKHEWFQRDLPAYLFPSPVEQDSSVIDTDAVNEVCEVSQ